MIEDINYRVKRHYHIIRHWDISGKEATVFFWQLACHRCRIKETRWEYHGGCLIVSVTKPTIRTLTQLNFDVDLK